MWPRTDLLELLGISHPIIQAPMSGFATPALAAAVSNAGGLGSLGCATFSADQVCDQVAATRKATNRPFNINFFVHPEPIADAQKTARVRAELAGYYDELGLGEAPQPSIPFSGFDEEQLQLILELRPRVVSFHFGLPEPTVFDRIKRVGCLVLTSATTVAEARALEAAGVDAIIAQGYEAGGHRGSFHDSPGAGLVGTMALVPQVADAVAVPVIAAGGIADGRGIAAAFALGASGVQMGTAFLRCPEAATSALHRAQLQGATDEGTQLTSAFTGRPARALRNRFTAEKGDMETLSFPLHASLVGPLQRVPDDAIRAQFMPFWAGQVAPLAGEYPAGQLIERLAAQAQAAFASGRAQV
jgi:nitronate monooxygenase